MAHLIGFQAKKITFKDGNTAEGTYLYITEERNGVTGFCCDRVFVSVSKIQGYVPVIGDEIRILYNRFGGCDGVELISRGS